jgi:hypothetical protein
VPNHHILIVTPDADDLADTDLFTYEVECPGVTPACEGWIECDSDECDHDELDEYAARGEGDHHGRPHRMIDGLWMVQTGHCAVVNNDGLQDEVAGRFPPGKHEIDFDFGDSDRDITILGRPDSRPKLIEGGAGRD